jgi:hypothetical protein
MYIMEKMFPKVDLWEIPGLLWVDALGMGLLSSWCAGRSLYLRGIDKGEISL